MPFKHKTIVLLTSVALLGAGCLQATTQTSTQESSIPTTSETTTDETRDAATILSVASPCPENMSRFWSTESDGDGFTFCFDELSQSGEPVMWEKNGPNRVVLYGEDTPDFTHSITRLEIGELDPKEAIENTLMTGENRQTCEVVSGANSNERWDEYVIAGGDLEKQLLCGEYRDGYFISLLNAPQVLFYVMIGQDTFMKTATWLETLQNTENE